MAERAIGAGLRAIRIRAQMTQSELSIAAGVPRSVVQAIERGRLDRIRVADLRAVAAAVDASVDVSLRWRAGDLPRLVNARHAAIHEVVAARYRGLAAWMYEPEVSFSSYGERGVIDGLGWHARSRSLLILELKSELVDLSDLMGSVDRKRRLATEVVRDRGWRPVSVSTWVVVMDTRSNRRALARHVSALRSKFPGDGHAIAAWLRTPAGRIDALSFLSVASPSGTSSVPTATRLVRRARDRSPMPNDD
jgi:transcriptional regulator with XRE-family HTH domain